MKKKIKRGRRGRRAKFFEPILFRCLMCKRRLTEGSLGAFTEDFKPICVRFECIMKYLVEKKRPLRFIVRE